MKRNKGIKRTILMLFVIVLSFSMVACDSSQETQSDNHNNNQTTNESISSNQGENDVTNDNSKTENNTSSEPKTHTEYVKTYFVYAEEGAVVTWYDPQTGQFRYKDKCETCGKVSGGEHSGGLFVSGSSKYNAGFTCTNSNCSMWGKSQRAIIACSESGEWVEVYD